MQEVVQILCLTKAFENAREGRRFALEELCTKYGRQYFSLRKIVKNRWWVSIYTSLKNFVFMHPILIQYFKDKKCLEIEKKLRQTEMELELNLTPTTMMDKILNPYTMYKIYVVMDMVETFCQGVALPMMSENITNIQMFYKFQEMFVKLEKMKSERNGKWEKIFSSL